MVRRAYIKYLRDGKNVPYGVVVAWNDGGIGWSLCNPKDTFNKKRALEIAFGRADHQERASFVKGPPAWVAGFGQAKYEAEQWQKAERGRAAKAMEEIW